MANPRCEVLVTFTYESITRFLGHEDHPGTFDRLFGTDEWRNALAISDAAQRRRFLHDLYARQLMEDAGVRYVRSFQMLDSGHRTENFLFFGTNHVAGLKAMKDAMWNVDPTGRFQFSDFTNPDQAVLFQLEPDFAQLTAQITARFAGCEPAVEEIEEFVLAQTPFKQTHYKRHVLKKLEYADPPQIEIVQAPEGRHRGTYPAGTVIRFP